MQSDATGPSARGSGLLLAERLLLLLGLEMPLVGLRHIMSYHITSHHVIPYTY